MSLPYLAALLCLADELDIAAERNHSFLYDMEKMPSARDRREFRKHMAIRRIELEPDRVVVYARTGLYTAATGLLFLAAILLAPIAGVIPGAATSPALVLIGMLMIHNATNIYWHQVEISLPSFLMIVGMPFTFSITTGVMLGGRLLRGGDGVQAAGPPGGPSPLPPGRRVCPERRAGNALIAVRRIFDTDLLPDSCLSGDK